MFSQYTSIQVSVAQLQVLNDWCPSVHYSVNEIIFLYITHFISQSYQPSNHFIYEKEKQERWHFQLQEFKFQTSNSWYNPWAEESSNCSNPTADDKRSTVLGMRGLFRRDRIRRGHFAWGCCCWWWYFCGWWRGRSCGCRYFCRWWRRWSCGSVIFLASVRQNNNVQLFVFEAVIRHSADKIMGPWLIEFNNSVTISELFKRRCCFAACVVLFGYTQYRVLAGVVYKYYI